MHLRNHPQMNKLSHQISEETRRRLALDLYCHKARNRRRNYLPKSLAIVGLLATITALYVILH